MSFSTTAAFNPLGSAFEIAPLPVRATRQHAVVYPAKSLSSNKFRIAAENPRKLEVVKALLQQQAEHRVLIIGEFIEQLEAVAALTGLPLITGKTPQREREQRYQEFRVGTVRGLILSRVGNFALDLPDADVLIQISGKYGSRQEEAQRLGRVLRPKSDGRKTSFSPWFRYALVRKTLLDIGNYFWLNKAIVTASKSRQTDDSTLCVLLLTQILIRRV